MPDTKIKGKDGTFMAYQSGSKGPGIVLIQEIFGVNKGIQITDKSQAEWDKAFELFKGFNQAKGVEDLIATLAHLRTLPGVKKAGCVGYCLGGQLAYLMAARSDVDCSVSYYGVGLDGLLGEAGRIEKPLLMHVAEKDRFVPPEAQAKMQAVLAKHPKVTYHVYEGQDHAFARAGGEHYNKQAADEANKRTAQFFKKNLA
jgi:carboxymethylenebutenolidase